MNTDATRTPLAATDTPESRLRTTLLVDAGTCVASGLLMVLGAAHLDGLLGMPRELLVYAGAVLFPIAAFIAAVAWRGTRSLPAIGVVVLGNLAWAGGATWVAAGGASKPTTLGLAFAFAQAATVLALSAAEIMQGRAVARG